jgi:hypothetical protein
MKKFNSHPRDVHSDDKLGCVFRSYTGTEEIREPLEQDEQIGQELWSG